MSKVQYVRAMIQDAQLRDEFIVELKFFSEGLNDLILFKTYNTKDAYVLKRIMEMCGYVNCIGQLIDHEVELAIKNRAIVAVRGVDEEKFYPMPSSELYYDDYGKLEYTQKELEGLFE